MNNSASARSASRSALSARAALDLSGVYPPIPTPFDASGNVAYDALRENIEQWNAYELSGYVVLGSNGEAALLETEEKVRLLQAARQAIPETKLLIAGTGCESTRETIALTRQAAEVGADAALVIAPSFYDGQMTHTALVRHYCAVADASPVPVLLYNMPKYTHVDMAATTIARAAEHPNVIGIKDSSGNITKLADIVRLTGGVPKSRGSLPDFQVLAGSAGFLYPALAVGAVGGVVALANIAPQQCINIWRWFTSGWWDQAADTQRQMVPVNTAVTATYGVPGLKAALDMLGYYGGPVRAPLLDLGENEREALKQILADGRLLQNP
jgi:4-hydroxy-2-oxoglutarate aldolase